MGTSSTIRAHTSSTSQVERVLLLTFLSLCIDDDDNDKPTAFNNTDSAIKQTERPHMLYY